MEFLTQLLNFVINVAIIILVIGVLVLVHEFGHFMVAKLTNIRVDEFSLGFGHKLISKKIGETEYMIKALPLGGYVKILGEEDEDDDPKIAKDPRNYKNKSKRVKFAVMLAGVTMNLLLAVIIFYISLARNGYTISLPGDFESFKPWFGTVTAQKEGDFIYDKLTDGGTAKTSGMPAAGYIRSVNGVEMSLSKDFVSYLATVAGKQATINVCALDANAKADLTACKDYKVNISATGTIGIEYYANYSFGLHYDGAVKPFAGFAYAADQLKIMGYYLSQLFAAAKQTGDYTNVAVNSASSPIALYFIVDRIRVYGVMAILDVVALMSFSLAIVNILPIPALDGGRVLILLIELVRRKPMSKKVEYAIIQYSFYALMALMLIIVLKDILFINIIKNLF